MDLDDYEIENQQTYLHSDWSWTGFPQTGKI